MISIKEIDELLEKKEPVMSNLDEEKKKRIKELKSELAKAIRRYGILEGEIDNEQNPPADYSAALTNLRELEKKIALLEAELRKLLGSSETGTTSRDISDIGTVAGNGGVVFRPQGDKFIVQQGTLTQETLTRLKKCIESKGKNFREELRKKGETYKDFLNAIQQDLKKFK